LALLFVMKRLFLAHRF